ncbi:MAG: putative cupin superfamily protein [Parasphingorhabdus sp.]|jgi:uncharacterized cupin superfamily protein
MNGSGITRLSPKGHAVQGLSEWTDMPLVGDVVGNMVPQERYYRAFNTVINSPTEVRAGVWQATAYAEKVTDYPYNEIVFVVEGTLTIIDEVGQEEHFSPGESFFLERGFNGEWRQYETVKIFHMTVDPKA